MGSTQELQRRGDDFATVRIAEIHGDTALGYYRLVVTLEFIISPQQMPEKGRRRMPAIESYNAELQVSRGSPDDRGEYYLLGRLAPQDHWQRIESISSKIKPQAVIGIGFNAPVVEAIEDVRQGGELLFKFTVNAIISDDQGTQPSQVTIIEPVSQSRWAKILEGMSYKQTAFLEIPVPDADRHPQLARAYDHFESARTEMQNGEWRKAVASCRDSLEQLGSSMGDGDKQDPEVQKLFEGSRKMGLPARYRTLRRALKLIAAAAHHDDDDTADIEWNRADAMLMVSMLGMLLRRFEKPPV